MLLEAGSPRSGRRQGWCPLRPVSSAGRWPSSPCVLTRPFLLSQAPLVSLPLLIRTPVPWIRTQWPHFNLITPLRTILRSWGLGLQHGNLRAGHESANNSAHLIVLFHTQFGEPGQLSLRQIHSVAPAWQGFCPHCHHSEEREQKWELQQQRSWPGHS